MFPRLIRKGLIECPRCKWKQDITSDSCPMCNFKFTKQPGSNINVYIDNNQIIKEQKHYSKFDLNKLEINVPSEFISETDKSYLKKYNGEFFKLIVDAETYNEKDLIDNFDKIINKANSKFIENEKSLLSVSVKEDLNNHEGFFRKAHMIELKRKYKKSYFDYYKYFNIENSINNYNSRFIENEKKTMLIEFNKYISNHKGIITDYDKRILKGRYDKGYCNYYVALNFGYLIDKKNEIEINKEKPLILKDFKEKLRVRKEFITDSDRINFRKEYTKYHYDFYDLLDFDSFINDFNNSISKNNIASLQNLENNELPIDEIISKIDCKMVSEDKIEVEELINGLDELVESSIIDLYSIDLNADESSKIIIKIKEDILEEKVSGDVSDILDFYFEQYKIIKKQISLNYFLNEYVKNDNFKILCNNYDLQNCNILDIIEKVRKDILIDDSMDTDKVVLKLEYYLKVELDKNDYFMEIDKIRSNRNFYLQKYNLKNDEFEEILNYIQLKITQGYYIKDINACLLDKIKQKIDVNRTEARLKLKKLINDADFIENNNLTQRHLEKINESVGELIYRNEIRSNDIVDDFLLKQIGRNNYGI